MAYAYTVRAGCRLCERWRVVEAELAMLDAPKATRINRCSFNEDRRNEHKQAAVGAAA